MTSEKTSGMTEPIKTWDNDGQDPVAWGTHDSDLAEKAYTEQHLQPGDKAPDFSLARKYWALPGVETLDYWTDASVSVRPVEGWIPFLVGSW